MTIHTPATQIKSRAGGNKQFSRRTHSAQKSDPDITVMIARGRLKEARLWLDHPRRRVRPKSRRGRIILGWVADHARLAYPKDPEGAVRRCCCELAPKLTEAELDELVVKSETSNKTWTHDHCAMVLGISFEDQAGSGFRFLGCDDDLNYDRRRERRESNNAAAARKYRARNGASTRRGRPPLSEADKAVRRAEDAARKRAERAAKSSGRPRGRPRSEGKCVQNNSSSYMIKNMYDDELTRTDFLDASPHGQPSASGALQAPPRLAPPPALVVLEGEIIPDDGDDDSGVAWTAPPPDQSRWQGKVIDQDGIEFNPPPPYQRRPAPKTWMDAAFEGYNGGRS